ncbi:MAG: peptidase M16 [Calditrichaeota bacterium]|nr:MAG: peptidase M16 [Calditrichota bacterium]
MATTNGFELVERSKIAEIDSEVSYFHHSKSGARFLSVSNKDENKVFGINFRTPPKSSNGIAHIMEHSVLCGSRKYPVKEPFVELIKGSLNTFLNAFTYPDKTCYPIASTNLHDFYNLVDVYLDAVFYPRLNEDVLRQEGWHYELQNPEEPLVYKGVVFNEMKGAYSSPTRIIAEKSQHSLFPDTAYGVESGGHPEAIPELTFDEFIDFHKTYYHPSNAFIYFYGDDNPEKRFSVLNEYLNDFTSRTVDSSIALQKRFKQTVKTKHKYFAGKDLGDAQKGVVSVNFLISDSLETFDRLKYILLDHILIGTPASPLRKALIDSGLGSDLSGHGLDGDLRQMNYSIGLRDIKPNDGDKVEALILDTLKNLAQNGIEKNTIDASLNTIEFSLRENNTGSYPRGLSMMIDALTIWLHDANPIDALAYEKPLAKLKSSLSENPRFFESIIETAFINNSHRTTLIFEPDESLEAKRQDDEHRKLSEIKNNLTRNEIDVIIKETALLQEKQNRPDNPEDLAKIPRLGLQDLEPKHTPLPIEVLKVPETEIVYHDLFTNGILYLELGFNLNKVPEKMLPYVLIFGRALLETGTEKFDQIELTQRIGKYTGGLWRSTLNSTIEDGHSTTSWLFIKGKAMVNQVDEMLALLHEILTTARLDNRDRIKQIVLDAKSAFENSLAVSGHSLAQSQLAAAFSKAGWISEKMNSLSYLFFLRNLEKRIEQDWQSMQADFEMLRSTLISRKNLICNCTVDSKNWLQIEPRISTFISTLPARKSEKQDWSFTKNGIHTGLSVPTQVNFVGKGMNIYEHGYEFHGSIFVISKYLRTTWLWDRVRVHGGAYGAFCHFNRRTGLLAFLSYRDPNLKETLKIFDDTASFLQETKINKDELTKSIIGTIGDIDSYMLADAKGGASLFRYLTGTTDEKLQNIRDEILGTDANAFIQFGEALESFKENGLVAITSSENVLQKFNSEEMNNKLSIIKVM